MSAKKLNRIICLVKPELPALLEKIETGMYFRTGQNKQETQNEQEMSSYMEGILLANNFLKIAKIDNNRGEYIGDCLVLASDGHLVHLERSGYWSDWVGELCHWQTRQKAISAQAAVKRYGFARIMSWLTAAIEREAYRTRLKRCLEQVQQIAAETEN